MKDTVLFRVEGGRVPKLGTGHLVRCLVLAELLGSRGRRVHFLLRELPGGVDLVKNKQNPATVLPAEADPAGELEVLKRLCSELSVATIVFDLPDSSSLVKKLGPLPGVKLVAVDELDQRFPPWLDVLVDPRLWAEEVRNRLGSSRCLLGPEYQVIDPSWSEFKKDNQQIASKVRQVTVSLGGADPMGLTPRVVRELTDYRRFEVVNVVYGPAATIFNKKLSGRNIRLYRAPENFPALVSGSDIVITSGGRTPYELASIGMPMIIVPTIEHERHTAAAFTERGLAVACDIVAGEPLEGALERIMQPEVRESLRRNCLQLEVGGKVDELLEIL